MIDPFLCAAPHAAVDVALGLPSGHYFQRFLLKLALLAEDVREQGLFPADEV